jgi:hypothetical protein
MDYEVEDPFDVVMFGYKRAQVDEFLRIQVEQEEGKLSQALRFMDLEQRLDRVLAENEELRITLTRMREELAANVPPLTASARVQAMLLLAEEEAAAIRAEAQTYAEQVRRQAREDANLAAAQRRHGEALTLSRHNGWHERPEEVEERKWLNGSPRNTPDGAYQYHDR